MNRRTLDILFSAGAVALAVLLGLLGLVMRSQADFADTYVVDQLSAQNIVFTPVDRLTDEEKQADCLVEYAGSPLTTGKQAECYANEYIGFHLTEINDGKTYAQTSSEARSATAAADAATAAGSADAGQLRATASALDGKTQTLFRGETLRGLLLTSYGFSILGERAAQAAWVAFAAALVLALAAIAGFVHAFSTPRSENLTL